MYPGVPASSSLGAHPIGTKALRSRLVTGSTHRARKCTIGTWHMECVIWGATCSMASMYLPIFNNDLIVSFCPLSYLTTMILVRASYLPQGFYAQKTYRFLPMLKFCWGPSPLCFQDKSSIALSCFMHLSSMSFWTSRLSCFRVLSGSSRGELSLNSPSDSISYLMVKYPGTQVHVSLGQCAVATKDGPPIIAYAYQLTE
jgi:hypothetical protein